MNFHYFLCEKGRGEGYLRFESSLISYIGQKSTSRGGIRYQRELLLCGELSVWVDFFFGATDNSKFLKVIRKLSVHERRSCIDRIVHRAIQKRVLSYTFFYISNFIQAQHQKVV